MLSLEVKTKSCVSDPTLPVPMHFLSLRERRQSSGRRVIGETLASAPAAILTIVLFPHFGIEFYVTRGSVVSLSVFSDPVNDRDPGRES